ncbi:MmgE/PrpD family protein [Geosporobacter ferrireducens]|uniref:MmgE/PrpD family protein n=1 Tax=Geosporobacter ferrireducens TaxID=1424294 RepID=UPI002354E059|nr:MmgE/PrpD family protein [Geosporobacter ferrireducens]
MSSLDRIIDVIEQIEYPSIPNDVVEKCKELFADWMSVTSAGSMRSESKHVIKGLQSSNLSKDVEQIACWLGTTSRMMDTDDGHRYAMGHPGVVIFSTAVAVAMHLGNVSGEKFIESVVRGYEMYCYQGRVINPSAYLERGFDATGVCGAPAAAVVAGTLMGLNREDLSNAVALSATLCGGLNQAAIDGSMQKYILAGWAAKLGIMSATLAKAKVDGPVGAYDGRLGYCNAFSPSPDLDYLQHPKLIFDIKYAYTKTYSCVRRIHTSLDAVEKIQGRHHWSVDQMEEINIYGCQFIVQAGNYTPINLAQAQTSIPYAIAILLKYGKVTEELIKDNIHQPDVLNIAKKVHIHLDEEFVKMAEKDKSLWGAAKVAIKTVNDELDEETVIYPRGEFENPFTRDEIKKKFQDFTLEAYPKEQIDKLWSFIMSIEKPGHLEGILSEIRQLFID